MLLISHNQSEANPEGIPNAYGSQNPDADFKAVARSLLKARKVAVVCGELTILQTAYLPVLI